MKQFLITLATSFLSFSALAQSSLDGFYFGGFLGVHNSKLSPGPNYAGAKGYVCSNCSTGKLGNVDTDSQTIFGSKIGYKYSDSIRFDLSHFKVSLGNTTWGTDFLSFNGSYSQIAATPFSANLKSDVLLASVYYKLPIYKGLSPYVGAGIGSSSNTMGTVTEGNYASPAGRTQTVTAYKVDLGFLYEMTDKIDFDFSVSLLNTGNFSSDTNRTYRGMYEVIAPYEFKSQINPIVSLGLMYKF
jgi:opacity protein-like surface antigen